MPGLDEPVGERSRAVVDAGSPVLPELRHHTPVFRDYVLPGYQFHPIVAHAAVAVSGDVAKLNERVPPVVGGKRILEQLLEPRLVEIVVRLLVLVALRIYQLERLRHDESHTLAHAPRKVKVNLHIPVNVVKAFTVRAVHVDGHLPCLSPVGDVLARERVGGALQFDDHFLHPLAVGGLGKVEVPVWSAQYILPITEHTAEKVLYIHITTS